MKQVNYKNSNRKNNKIQTKVQETGKNLFVLRKILLSIMSISLSSTALITATTALFTGEEEVKTHVVTGNLDFDFKRTNLFFFIYITFFIVFSLNSKHFIIFTS